MKCSVIVATHNHSSFLGRCLRSIFSQVNSPDFEIIVIDDASIDNTPEILKGFSSEITLLTNDENLGLPASLNLGIEESRGDYIVRVDSDDYVSRHFLNVLTLALDSNPTLDAVESDYIVFNDSDESGGTFCSALEEPIACGIMFRRESMFRAGLYSPEFLLHEDKEFRWRFESQHKIGHIPIPLYRYRRHSENITNDKERMARYDVLLQHRLSQGR